jgi:hypothetical protein
MIYNFIIRYPFSNKAKEFLKSKNINLFDVDEKIIKQATLFLLKNIPQNYNEQERRWNNYKTIDDPRVAELFVKLYPISKILVLLVNNISLTQSFANYYEKQLRFYLLNALDENELNDIINDLCPNLCLELDKYYISLIDLLSLDLGDDYKLEYSNLENGNIFLKKEEVIDLLSIILKKKILRTENLEKKEYPKLFLEYSKFIENKILELDTFKIYNNFKINKPNINEYPPCFKKLYTELISGRQLSHYANYHLAVFLANIGYNLEEILNFYRNAPNFDEKIARYQIKNIFDKKYSVASCQTIKSNGFCVNDCKVKHPLQLFNKSKTSKENKNDKESAKYKEANINKEKN